MTQHRDEDTRLVARLSEVFEELSPSPSSEFLRRLHSALEHTTQRHARSWPGVGQLNINWLGLGLGVGAAFLAFLLAVAGAGILSRQGASPRPLATGLASRAPSQRPSAVAEATPTPSPSPTSSLPPSRLYTRVERASIPDPSPQVFGGEAPDDIVVFHGDLVAVGGVNAVCCAGGYSPDTRATVWVSHDGITWQLLPRQTSLDNGHMSSLAANDRVLVSVGGRTLPSAQPGNEVNSGAVWWSSDGRTWHLITGYPQFISVTSQGGVFYALALASDGDEIWSSGNGQTWRLAANKDDLRHSNLQGVVATSLGIFAWGSMSEAGSPTDVSVIWRSTDGVRWSRVGSGVVGGLEGVVGLPQEKRVLAFGQDGQGQPAVWISSDGINWSSQRGPAGADAGYLAAGATTRGFLLAGVTPTTRQLRLWSSMDGAEWADVGRGSRVFQAPATDNGLSITAFAELADSTVAIIGRRDAPGLHGISEAWLLRP